VALCRHGGRRAAALGPSPQRASLNVEDQARGPGPVKIPRPLILDEKYDEAAGFPAPGFCIVMGLQARFYRPLPPQLHVFRVLTSGQGPNPARSPHRERRAPHAGACTHARRGGNRVSARPPLASPPPRAASGGGPPLRAAVRPGWPSRALQGQSSFPPTHGLGVLPGDPRGQTQPDLAARVGPGPAWPRYSGRRAVSRPTRPMARGG
jgi:hypothetical protein